MSKSEVRSRKSEVGRHGRQRALWSSLFSSAFCLLPFTFFIAAFCFSPSAFFNATSPDSQVARTGAHGLVVRRNEDDEDEVLRRAALVALGGREGAVMVLDARTGRVRALAGGRSAYEEATPPGSAIKPFTMLTALRSGALDEETRVYCRGRYHQEDFKINCSHPRYRAAFGPAQALANSCNYFFAHVAESLDGDAYARTLREFGFGVRTGGGDEHEAAGLLPHETARVREMLGESSELRVSPAQLIAAYAALFNGGRLLAPRMARAEGFTPLVRAQVEIAPAHRALLLAGMRGAVAYGTASRAGLATLPVYVFGKTGTSTPRDNWRAQGWFVGFAAGLTRPGGESSASQDTAPDDVRLAVLVFLKRSRGAEAAELARPIFEAYARTLSARDEPQLADLDVNREAHGARSSNSNEGGTDKDGGTVVHVRLSRGDATLALPLEEYVFGVLAAEGSVEPEAEALKALAVVARTYALKNLRRHARDHFDLCDTTHCQRFAPFVEESARPEFYELARRAVRETAGEVLRDASGRVAESYFSAACGGRTADISKLWGVARAPAHLRGVRDDFCAGADESWTDVIASAQLLRALRADERSDVGARLESVRVLRRDQTGRAEMIELEGTRRRLLRGWDFKIIVGRTLGWNVLKSSRFDVERAGTAFVFHGTGFGHGLGLCQAGAHVSASRGASYRQILSRYFPGTSVGRPEARETNVGLRDADVGLRIDESHAIPTRDSSDSSSTGDESVSAIFQHANFQQEPSSVEHAVLGSQLSVLIRGNPQTANRDRIRSEHFSLSYPARVARREAEALLRTFETARADVARRLERASVNALIPDVEVVVHETTGDFVGATGQPAWVAAVTTGRRIELQPLDVLRRRGLLLTTPRHEFVHAALESVGGGRAPRWLVEGLAAHVAGEGTRLARSTALDEKVSTEELERRLARPGTPREMRSLYAAAYAEVSALLRREGEAAVWRRALR
jgi:SpoIID/LytB domain protein